MGKTSIEWTEQTWNPITGCSKVSQGCKNCYAERLAERFWGERKFTEVRFHTERLDQPLHWRKPRMVFVNSMSDLFHEALTFEKIGSVFGIMAEAERHTFQVLTKRPARMNQFARWFQAQHEPHGGPFPNVWLGVSIEDQAAADARIPLLLQTPAVVRFLSVEPLLGPVDLRHIHYDNMVEIDALTGDHGVIRPLQGHSSDRIDWVIVGAESGPHARPCDLAWVRALRDQCSAAGVAFFFKQQLNERGHKVGLPTLDGRQWAEMP